MHLLANVSPARGLLMVLGLVPVSLLANPGCSGIRPPDPYMGTVDGLSGTNGPWDPLFSGAASGPLAGCLAPRPGYGPDPTSAPPMNWYYLGVLSKTQMDVGNVTDPTRTPTTGAYIIDGCAPQGNVSFNERTDNFVRSVQYPVLVNTAQEPTSATSYKPWFVQIPASIVQSKRPNIGCNDIKSERSVQDRGGYDKTSKTWGNPGDLDLTVMPPTGDQIRKGDPAVVFKDWPMYNLGTPIMKSTNPTACPFATGAPVVAGSTDPNAMFQFPSKSWLRGLLDGYLDGGTVPIMNDPKACAGILPASNRCATDGCICPQVNEVYMQAAEVLKAGKLDTTGLGSGSVTLTATDGSGRTRTASILATFRALPGQTGFSPVCRLRVYDATKITCTASEVSDIAPRKLCSLAELSAAPATVTDLLPFDPSDPKKPGTFIHCLFLQGK